MPILMKYEGINGESELRGKAGYLELTGLSWGVTRSNISGKAASRGEVEPRVDEVVVTRMLDSASANVLKEALVGDFGSKVEIHFTRTGPQNRIVSYAIYEMENCGVSAYNIESGGDIPQERLRLSFTKIQFKSYKVTDDINAVPDTVLYDLLAATGG
jgi:type VI protein secretion system component Hcp